MQELLDRNLKDVIDAFPAVATVLDTYGIACSTCQAGSCRLRDVVGIHNLTEEDEAGLFAQIAVLVYPGQQIELPRLPRRPAAEMAVKLSPPLKLLVAEHVHIMQVVAAIPSLVADLAATLPTKAPIIRQAVAFIREYADGFHHAKEEDLLFTRFDPTLAVIATMLEEHEIARGHLRAVVAGLDAADATAVAEYLTAYGDLLTGHIRKEDDILYPWIDRQLTVADVGRIYAASLEIDRDVAARAADHVAFADALATTATHH